MKVLVWIAERTWESCVDAARFVPGGQVVLLHVIDPDSMEAVSGARAGLLGRAMPAIDASVEEVLTAGQIRLFDAAEDRLGRPATRLGQRGRVERVVVAAAATADVLVMARDGDHTRLGPRSLGHASRFVLDHAPCQVLLVWPEQPPDLGTLPPPPGPHGPHSKV
ncbi:MAG TPA: universal stress protein [Micromonosporaceae bacterium]|jgi:nucleotide-binding universal stress UspA family protein